MALIRKVNDGYQTTPDDNQNKLGDMYKNEEFRTDGIIK